MAGSNLLVVVTVVALIAKDGALSCPLRNRKCDSSSSVSDSTSVTRHKTSCGFSSSKHNFDLKVKHPIVTSDLLPLPQHLPIPESPIASNLIFFDQNQHIMNALLKQLSFATTPVATPAVPLESLSTSLHGTTPSLPSISTSYSAPDPNSEELKQIISLFLPASEYSLMSTPTTQTGPPSSNVPNVIIATNPVDVQNTLPPISPASEPSTTSASIPITTTPADVVELISVTTSDPTVEPFSVSGVDLTTGPEASTSTPDSISVSSIANT